MGVELRDYQREGVEQIRDAFKAHRRVLYVLPTGAGKTVSFAFIAAGVASKGRRLTALCHRDLLLDQISAAFTSRGIHHGVLRGGMRYTTHQQVVVASMMTMAKRLEHFPEPSMVIVDEAHRTLGETYQKILKRWPKTFVLGVTATPVRGDQGGLGDVFDHMIEGPTTAELTAMGFLSPAVVYAPQVAPDLRGLRTRGGDYIASEIEALMDAPKITGDAVSHYRRICPGQPAVAFCCSIRHAEDVASGFRGDGWAAKCVHGKMDRTEIRQVFADFAAGKVQIVTSADILSEGIDCPNISCAILLRPTKSMGLFLQQVGRAIRIAPGKTQTIILDHASNVTTFGLPDEDRAWTLEKTLVRKMKSSAPTVRTCPACFAMHRPMPRCPVCGYEYQAQGRQVEQVDGELQQVTGGQDGDHLAELERRFHILRSVAKRRGREDPTQWALSVVAGGLARQRAKTASVLGAAGPMVNGLAVGDYDELKERVMRAMSKEAAIAEVQGELL